MARTSRWIVIPSSGGVADGSGAKPCSASQRGRYSPATLPCGHHSGALGVAARTQAAAAAATDQEPALDHRLTRVRWVRDAGQAGDPRDGHTRLMRGEPAELQQGVDAVAGRPCALGALDAPVLGDEDEALLVGGEALDRRADQPRHGVHALDLEPLPLGSSTSP